jgi:alpha-beta hydrolase superfamily lysophospholipase
MPSIDVARLRSEYKGPHELVVTSDGKTLFVRRWPARGEPRVSVLIMHGITAYSGPYGPMVADQLSSSDFDVYGMDLRGHGLSDGRRGDYPSEERFVKDLRETVRLVKSKSKRLVIMGHSLGGMTAVVAAKNCPGDIDGLALVSIAKRIRTGVYPKQKTGAMLKALAGVAIFRGSPLIEYRREGQLGLDDPLFNFHYSARFYSVVYAAGALRVMGMLRSGLVESPNLKFNAKLHFPIYVAVGEKDELFSVDAAKDFCDGIDADDKEFQVIPGARHAIWPVNAFAPLVDWLGRKF